MAENPATETRGGKHPDWANAKPGEPLPELPGPAQGGREKGGNRQAGT
jgi:hypothetical protein